MDVVDDWLPAREQHCFLVIGEGGISVSDSGGRYRMGVAVTAVTAGLTAVTAGLTAVGDTEGVFLNRFGSFVGSSWIILRRCCKSLPLVLSVQRLCLLGMSGK